MRDIEIYWLVNYFDMTTKLFVTHIYGNRGYTVKLMTVTLNAVLVDQYRVVYA